ncbi:carboxypeptidase Y-deficient [Massospora cicadina]|nr:carboxypeptidase Y-deficient [Massospora cicadina]
MTNTSTRNTSSGELQVSSTSKAISVLASRPNSSVLDSPRLPPRPTEKQGSTSSRETSSSPIGIPVFDPSLQRLMCPVCNISMPNLTDLNRHLDLEHMEKEEKDVEDQFFSDSDEDVSDAIIKWLRNAHQKVIRPLSKKTPSLQQLQKLAKGSHPDVVFETHIQQDNENTKPIVVSDSESNQPAMYTAHFKSLNNASHCARKGCGKTLGILSGKINCRKCGEVFCEDDCSLQMRLDQRARHDPKNGLWGRVKGRDLFKIFSGARSKTVDRRQLEANRIVTRLERIAYSPGGPPMQKQVLVRTAIGHFDHWHVESITADCVGAKASLASLLKEASILVCKDCIALVKRRHGIRADAEPLVVSVHALLKVQQETILRHLPLYNDLILAIKGKKAITAKDEDVRSALLLRQKLLDAFFQVRCLEAAPSDDLQARLIVSVCAACVQFLQTNTVSLAALPRLLNTPAITKEPKKEPIKIDPDQMIIHQKISVFQEQANNLESLLAEATSLRRLDDVKALNLSLHEISEEIKALRSKLQQA